MVYLLPIQELVNKVEVNNVKHSVALDYQYSM